MSEELLQKEQEFRKLNDELEIRTKTLMYEVDSILKIHNDLKNNPTNVLTELKLKEFNYENDIHNNTSNILALNKCFKTKISLLSNDLEDTKIQSKNKSAQLKQLQIEYDKLEEERNKWQQFAQTQKQSKTKSLEQIASLNSKLQIKETELIALRKENESLKHELKLMNTNQTNNELRYNKLLEENEKLKTNFKNAKLEEKELCEVNRKNTNELLANNKRFEKQLTELKNGFKKQLQFIDNLKKQKMYLESLHLTEITEENFSRILDWKPTTV